VGVCVRNSEGSIEDAIRSIIDQDFPHDLLEVVFVDDGSEDRTLAVINGFVPKLGMPVKVFHHEWKGLGYSRNVVVNNANGEYIVWVDGDMILPKDFLRKQVEFMDKNPGVGIGKGRYGVYDSTSLAAYLENIEAVVEFLDCEQKILSNPLGTGGSIYRVEAIRNVGGFNENIRVGEDTEAEYRIKKAGWLLKTTSVEFFEMRRENWKALWIEYFWHGFGGHLVYKKVSRRSMIYKMFPPTAIVIELLRSFNAYRAVHRKVVFLLPFHWIFKRTAWCLGFALDYLRSSKLRCFL
jgi:glycosyltransferase involved in cell wall biosynthesis